MSVEHISCVCILLWMFHHTHTHILKKIIHLELLVLCRHKCTPFGCTSEDTCTFVSRCPTRIFQIFSDLNFKTYMKVAHIFFFIQYKFHVCQVPRLRMSKAVFPLSYMPSWPALGQLHFYLSQILQLLTPAAYNVSHFLSVTNCTGCGRKNVPIWEGHSYGWGECTVMGSASSNSGVRAVFSVHHGVVGRTSSLYC